jgi:hypothetical protein
VGKRANQWRKPVDIDVHRLLFLAPNVTRRRRRVTLGTEVENITASSLAYASGLASITLSVKDESEPQICCTQL